MRFAGIVFVVSGIAAISFPFMAGIALDLVYAAILTVAGGAAFVQTWKSPATATTPSSSASFCFIVTSPDTAITG